MADHLPNLYSPNLSGVDPQSTRIIRDVVERMNYLTTELDRVRKLMMSSSPGVDAARKESPIEGIITIPSRDAGGQDGAVRVSRDGVISSYVNVTEGMFPYVDLSTVGNVTTGLDPLHTLQIPAGTLGADGDVFHMRYGGALANTEADKQIQVQLDGQLISAFGGVIDIEQGSWAYDIYSVRTSSTTVRSSITATLVTLRKADGALVAAPSGGFVFAQVTDITVSNLNTNTLALTVFGEGTNTDDVTQTLSFIELYRPRTRKFV